MTLATNKMKPRRPNKYCTSKCHLKTSSKFTKCCPKYCTSHEKDLQHFSHPRLPTSEQGAQYTAPATQIKKMPEALHPSTQNIQGSKNRHRTHLRSRDLREHVSCETSFQNGARNSCAVTKKRKTEGTTLWDRFM
jgi:hypothetical protein